MKGLLSTSAASCYLYGYGTPACWSTLLNFFDDLKLIFKEPFYNAILKINFILIFFIFEQNVPRLTIAILWMIDSCKTWKH